MRLLPAPDIVLNPSGKDGLALVPNSNAWRQLHWLHAPELLRPSPCSRLCRASPSSPWLLPTVASQESCPWDTFTLLSEMLEGELEA